ncbi:MAG: sodium:solute symporter family protein [Planctomycetota bacterium]
MPSSTTVLLVACGYLLLSLVVGILPGARSSKSATGFVAGDRGLGLLVMYFITGATIFSAFAFLGAPGWAYSRGAAAFYILAYGTLGFVPFYFVGPRAARLGRFYGFVTQAEMVAHRFRRPALAGVMALISTIAFIPYLALQMKGAGYVFSALTRGAVAEWAGAAIVYGVVLIYVLRSGVLGVGWTNTLQGIFMLALAWGLGLYLPHALHGGVGEMFALLKERRPELLTAPGLDAGGAPWHWAGYSSAVLVSVLGFSFWPHLFMKAFTARDERVLKKTVVLYPTFQLFLLPIILIGFAGVMFEPAPEAADQILPHMLMNMKLPALLVGLFCAGALAASMSSGDTIAHAAASIIVRDGLMTAGQRRLPPVREMWLIRIVVVLVLVVAYVTALLYRDSLVMLLLYAYGPVVQFMPAVAATLYWSRATGTGVLLGLVAGIAVNIAAVVWPAAAPWPIHAGAYGLAANVLILVCVSLLSGRARDSERQAEEARFLRIAAGRER